MDHASSSTSLASICVKAFISDRRLAPSPEPPSPTVDPLFLAVWLCGSMSGNSRGSTGHISNFNSLQEMAEFKPVLLALPSLTPSLAVEILPFGLTLHRVIVQADECSLKRSNYAKTHDIVVGPESPEGHATQKYVNTIIGRFSNRIPAGTHIIERNGIKGQMTVIANEGPDVSLHGGITGFDSMSWLQLNAENPPTLFTAAELSNLQSPNTSYAIFRLISPDGNEGFPGKLVTEALVALIGPGEQRRKYRAVGEPPLETPEYDLGSIILVYRAKLDEKEKVVTPVNLTQHWGFNLEASLRDGPLPTVLEHTLTLKSDRAAKLGPGALPTHNYLLAEDYPEHGHFAKKIGYLSPQRGYGVHHDDFGPDDFYLLQNEGASHIPTRIPLSSFDSKLDLIKEIVLPSNDAQGNPTRGNRPASVAELSSAKTGIKLLFDTNQHGVMFYTNIGANPAVGARKKIHGGSGIKDHGDGYGPGSAAFLEFHEPISAFLDPKNKDKEDSLLTTDELYHNYVRLDVKFTSINSV
ncbi:hypothetical protein C0995_015183 [Termitomyces sp. Mi166|nr:hypothetical protein C0995_015183 [Termitomyces sp. Mi166\